MLEDYEENCKLIMIFYLFLCEFHEKINIKKTTKQKRPTDMNITINNHTTTHDEGVHPAEDTSPWFDFQRLGPLLLCSKV